MRKSQKSSTYLHPKMLKIFVEGTPLRQGFSHLIGHNIYENVFNQKRLGDTFLEQNPFFLWEFNMGKMDEK